MYFWELSKSSMKVASNPSQFATPTTSAKFDTLLPPPHLPTMLQLPEDIIMLSMKMCVLHGEGEVTPGEVTPLNVDVGELAINNQ